MSFEKPNPGVYEYGCKFVHVIQGGEKRPKVLDLLTALQLMKTTIGIKQNKREWLEKEVALQEDYKPLWCAPLQRDAAWENDSTPKTTTTY